MSRINTNISSLQAIHKPHRNNNDTRRLERAVQRPADQHRKGRPGRPDRQRNARWRSPASVRPSRTWSRFNHVINTAEAHSARSPPCSASPALTNEAANSGALRRRKSPRTSCRSIRSSTASTASPTRRSSTARSAQRLAGLHDERHQHDELLQRPHQRRALPAMRPSTSSSPLRRARRPRRSATPPCARRRQQRHARDRRQQGREQLSFGGGTTVAEMVTAINNVKNSTGVSAIVSGGTNLGLYSTAYGSTQYVSLLDDQRHVRPDRHQRLRARRSSVTINEAPPPGRWARDQLPLQQPRPRDRHRLRLQHARQRQLLHHRRRPPTSRSAPRSPSWNKVSLGISSVSVGALATTWTGSSARWAAAANNLSSDRLVTAQRILDKSIKVAQLRGRLAALPEGDSRSPTSTVTVLENVTASESAIRDADFAEETAALTRSQILVQATTSVLAQANLTPQNKAVAIVARDSRMSTGIGRPSRGPPVLVYVRLPAWRHTSSGLNHTFFFPNSTTNFPLW